MGSVTKCPHCGASGGGEAAPIPTGWKLVPASQPTKAMEAAYMQAETGDSWWEAFCNGYKAMIEAAPSIGESAAQGPFPLPENWRITIDCEKKQAIVTHPNIGGYAASDDQNNIAGTMLYWLAVALARAPVAGGSYVSQPDKNSA